ncbi:hypothetical protein [Streptomyces sp. NPDC093094]|uniref:hypothetical protein n=1 Tax=Streptomyces sp. NPDC093094 TaxID=3366026 RepID=UPI003824B152
MALDTAVRGAAREHLLRAARGGEALPSERARHVRVIEYDVPDRGEVSSTTRLTTVQIH